MKTQLKTKQVLILMKVVSWIAFIGFMIEGGAILVSYGVSIFTPEGAQNLYKGLNLYNLRQFSFYHYTATISLLITLLIQKAYIAFLVIQFLSKIDLVIPFKREIVNILDKIYYIILGMWFIAILYNAHSKWLLKRGVEIELDMASTDFIFLAGVVFIISFVFKKGEEIQTENELTV